MNALQSLSWENFRTTVFCAGEQRLHRLGSSPLIEVFGDGIGNRVGVCIEVAVGTPIPPELTKREFLTTRSFDRDGRHLLEVATPIQRLHRQFFHVAVAIAERVILERASPVDAIIVELDCFSDLLREELRLGIERQLGLIGELVFLNRLLDRRGVTALESWLGPSGDTHDFRFGEREFEVKTTIVPRRTHTINGTEQLVASPKHSLYLVSILLGAPGAGVGFSLADLAERTLGRFAGDRRRLEGFTGSLEAAVGLKSHDLTEYSRKYDLRRPIGIGLVNDQFPAITRGSIDSVLGPLSARIGSVQYEISVEGLVDEDGSAEFDRVLSENG